MLKLMKYEFIHSYRTFFISFITFLGACILMPFIMNGILSDIPILSILLALGFSVLIMGIIIALFVSIVINYDRSMFKRPAYLTLTLPVSTTELIIAKVLTTILWLIIAVFVFIIGTYFMGLVSAFLNDSLSMSSIIDGIRIFGKMFWEYLSTQPLNLLANILYVIGELLMLVGGIYVTMTIVHTKWFRKHRLIYGLIIYIVLNFIIEYFSFTFFPQQSLQFGGNIGGITNLIFAQALFFIIVGILLAIGTIYLIDSHLEIE